MTKLQLDFKGFEGYIETLNKLGADIVETTEKALQESGTIINEALHEKMKAHQVTGDTEKSIIESKVKWNGTKAYIKFGFNYKKGGMPALYLEKGRPHQNATPVIKPALEESRDQIKKVQETTLKEFIERAKK